MINLELEKSRCLNCAHRPCSMEGCPLNNDIPDFIHAEGEAAMDIVFDKTVLPSVCGRICPQYKQCQGSCVHGKIDNPLEIGIIEAGIGDAAILLGYKIKTYIDESYTNKKVAVIGGGPSGLTCAAFLARKGIKVTIYEKHDELGGLLVHGIPEFRLSKTTVEQSIKLILDLGIEVKLNQELGKDFMIDDIKSMYDAIYIAIGANEPIITMEGSNIYSANALLESKNFPDFENKKVCISGGGNTAIDMARVAKRMGAEAQVIYRRSEKQMPAEPREVDDASRDGVEFMLQTNILNYSNHKLTCIKTELVKLEDDDRLSPVNIDGTEFEVDCDYLILANGSCPNKRVVKDFTLNKGGYISVNENLETSIENVFAGGDVIGTRATVAWAARNGRDAADRIINKLKNN